MKETEIGIPVSHYLQEAGWEVYHEVRTNGPIADIVGKRASLLWVVECKRTCSLALLDQALHWLTYAHFVSVATRGAARSATFDTLLRDYGIGHFLVDGGIVMKMRGAEKRRRVLSDYLARHLAEPQKTFCDPGARSGYWTPFKETCARVLRIVKKKPGLALRELAEECRHHYSTDATFRASMCALIRQGVVPGVRMDTETRPYRVYVELEK